MQLGIHLLVRGPNEAMEPAALTRRYRMNGKTGSRSGLNKPGEHNRPGVAIKKMTMLNTMKAMRARRQPPGQIGRGYYINAVSPWMYGLAGHLYVAQWRKFGLLIR